MDHQGVPSAFDHGTEVLVTAAGHIILGEDRCDFRTLLAVFDRADGHLSVGPGDDADLGRLEVAAVYIQVAEQVGIGRVPSVHGDGFRTVSIKAQFLLAFIQGRLRAVGGKGCPVAGGHGGIDVNVLAVFQRQGSADIAGYQEVAGIAFQGLGFFGSLAPDIGIPDDQGGCAGVLDRGYAPGDQLDVIDVPFSFGQADLIRQG